MFLRNPHPTILDDDEDIFFGSSGEEMDFPFFGDRLNAVDEEIRNSQIELADIDLQQGQLFLKMGFDLRIFYLGVWP
jgi:hypothetical protein